MRYYCNICRKDITKQEYLYSVDKFDKPLCREHQNSYRQPNTQQIEEQIDKLPLEIPKQKTEVTIKEPTPPTLAGFLKKVAVTTGKVIKESASTVAQTAKKTVQTRDWKDQILRRMYPNIIKQFAREKRIHPAFIDKPTIDDYIRAIKLRVTLEEIINYAKRNSINIRDILTQIEQAKATEEIKEMTKNGKDIDDFFLQVVDVIKNFKPFKRYSEELPYQIDLARWLESRFPGTKIEETRGSTRPDIVIKGIAIEVKGPTFHQDLQTVSDKCMRYRQYFPQGMIVVLFDVNVNQYRYEDWLKGMKKTFSDVIVIKK